MRDSPVKLAASPGWISRRTPVSEYLRLMRPNQWPKNLLVLVPLIFSHNLLAVEITVGFFMAFVAFCLASSSIYALNDVLDAEADRSHPKKQHRPVASGAVARPAALALSGGLLLLALGLAFGTQVWLGAVIAAYWITHALYSSALKHVAILDVMLIGLGFVLRVVGGTTINEVPPSEWLLLAAFLLALFLACGKRRQELRNQGERAIASRPSLAQYEVRLLDRFLAVLAGSVAIVYAVFTLSEYATQRFESELLIYTVPFVSFGLFRYLYMMHKTDSGEDPLVHLFHDRILLVCVGLWTLSSILAIYLPKLPALAGFTG